MQVGTTTGTQANGNQASDDGAGFNAALKQADAISFVHTAEDDKVYAQLKALAQTYNLKLNNQPGEHINPARLAIIIATSKEKESLALRYRYGITQLGDDDGKPISVTLPDNCSWQNIKAFEKDIRKSFLSGEKFESIDVNSDGGKGGVIPFKDGHAFVVFPSIAFPAELMSFQKAEEAPFYKDTKYLNLNNCFSFEKLTEGQKEYLRTLASTGVKIVGNTTVSNFSWKYNEEGPMELDPGPGGNAFAFMPDKTIAKVLRCGDSATIDRIVSEPDLLRRHNPYKDNSPLYNSIQMVIDERSELSEINYTKDGSPQKMIFNTCSDLAASK